MIKGARRSIVAIAAALSLGVGGAAWAASAASAASARPAIAVAECKSGQLAVWVSPDMGEGTAGSVVYPLEFTNISKHTCYLIGYPGVSALNAKLVQLGSPAGRNSVLPSKAVVVAPGGTASAVLQWVEVLNYPLSVCKPAQATELRVYPPDQKVYRDAFASGLACSKKGPVYLSITRIEPGANLPS